MNSISKHIKNFKSNPNDPKVRAQTGIFTAIGGIFINLVLFAFKLTVGILSFSMSIISDAINNLTDLFSCFLNLFGFKLASLPADKRHPYGHERIEYITGLIISFIIVSVGIVLGYSAISALISRDSQVSFDIFAFIVLGASILFKIILGLFYRYMGHIIDSETLKASMLDSFNDAICTTGVLIAAIINHFVSIWWLDPTISLCIAVFIIYSGIKSILETASPLIGIAPDSELIKNITNDVLSNKIVLGVHDLTCHTYGHTKIFVTLHAEVDGYQNMMDVHDEIDNIESELDKKYGIELTIHMDPIDTKNKEIPILKEQIMKILNEIDPYLSFHDLRLVVGPTHTNVLFDVVKDQECVLQDDDLASVIKNEVESLNSTYNVIIKIDHKY